LTPEFTELLAFKNWLIKIKSEGRKKFRDLLVEYLEDAIQESQADVDDRIETLKESVRNSNDDE